MKFAVPGGVLHDSLLAAGADCSNLSIDVHNASRIDFRIGFFVQLVPLIRGFAVKSLLFTVHAEKKLSRYKQASRYISFARSLHARIRDKTPARPSGSKSCFKFTCP